MKQLTKLFFKLVAFFIVLLPRRVQYFIGDTLGFLWFDVFRIRRDVVLSNLKIAFPQWTNRKRTKVGRKSLFNMGRNLVEYAYLPFLNLDAVDYRIEGEENFSQAMAKGKGVCLLTLHLGNGDLAIAILSLRGVPLFHVSKEFKVKWLNDLWFNLRRHLGTQFIPARNSSYAILKALKKKAAVTFVQDQFMGPPIGVKSKFFGKETGTAMGLSLIAERSQAAVVPTYTYRDDKGCTVICFEPEIPFLRRDDSEEGRDESLARMTQVYNDKIEEFIKKYPEQWMWVHKRWKTYED